MSAVRSFAVRRVEIPWLHDDGVDVIDVTLSGWLDSDGEVHTMCLFDAAGRELPIPPGYEDQAQTEILEAAEQMRGTR
jgi:hypothetical protein